jgi:ABC-2 type transport system permease protein
VDWSGNGLVVLHSIARVMGWTPLGAAWAAPADAASGDFAAAAVKMLIGLAFVGVLWLTWRALVSWMLTTPEREARARNHVGLGWFTRMPANPAGAIAARSITYWLRDARYRVALVIVPIVPAIMVMILLVGGVSERVLVLLPVPIMCFFLAWSTVHNDIAFDNSAIWLHIASGVSGRADRIGRVVPAAALGAVIVLIGSPVCAWIAGDWLVLPSLVGVSGCVLLCGLGLSSIVSARFPYPTVRPGDSPFAQPQSSATAATGVQSLTVLAILGLSAPAIGLAVVGFSFGLWWHVAALCVGLVVGGVVLALGIVWGGRIFESRGPELLAFTLRN